MNKFTFFSTSLIFALTSVGVSANTELLPAERENKTDSVPAQKKQQLQEDLLRQESLSEQNAKNASINASSLEQVKAQLIANPQQLEELFAASLVKGDKTYLPLFIETYKQTSNYDSSLIEWAEAILSRDTKIDETITLYRKLLANFSDNYFIRFQLAESLFLNQDFETAKEQFERLRAVPNLAKEDISLFDKYIEAIEAKDRWNFSFAANFLNDKNLANAAKPGTQMTLANGAIVTYDTPRQSGQGISTWVGADKRWGLSDGKYVTANIGLSSKYYWDNKKYNDLSVNTGLGLGYADARFNIEFVPSVSKRWYAGGANSTPSLKQHSDVFGASLSSSYWLKENLKYGFYYNFSYDQYPRAQNKHLTGANHLVSNSLAYFPSTKQYWQVALDFSKKYTRSKQDQYLRYGTRLTWGQEWPLGISTSTTLGVAKREYVGSNFLLSTAQKNTEYSANVSVWHKQLHVAGFTPKLTWSYAKTNSNIPIYAYDKHQFFVEVGKSF